MMFFRKKEFNNLPEAEWTWKGYTKKQLIISVLVLYVILMISTGLVVHYGFCQGHSTKSAANLNTQRSAFAVARSQHNLTFERDATWHCPVPANCSSVRDCERPLCPGEVLLPLQPCPTTPEPPCTQSPPCIQQCGTTCAPTGMTRTTEPPNITLTIDDMTRTETVELIKRNPVQSFARLQVIINLMENWFERYHTIYTRRSCGFAANAIYNPQPQPAPAPCDFRQCDSRRICPLCNDRYDYLRCVFLHPVDKAKDPKKNKLISIPSNANQIFNGKAFFSSYDGKFEDKLTADPKYLSYADYTESLNHNMQGAMSFTFGTGPKPPACTPCDGEVAKTHMQCITHRGKTTGYLENKLDMYWPIRSQVYPTYWQRFVANPPYP